MKILHWHFCSHSVNSINFCSLATECRNDLDCPTTKYCETSNLTCADPCLKWLCGPNSYGTPITHKCFCQCIEGFTGNPTDPEGCSKY